MLALFLCRTSFTDTKCNSAKSNNLFRLQKISVLSKKKNRGSHFIKSHAALVYTYIIYMSTWSAETKCYTSISE